MQEKLFEFILKVSQSPQLKEELKKNPKQVLERETGTQLTEISKVVVLENTEQTIYIPLYSIQKAQELAQSLKTNPLGKLFLKECDTAFREKLKKNPREALQEIYKTPISEKQNIQVVEIQDDTLCLILPSHSEMSELSEAELSQLAGGFGKGGGGVGIVIGGLMGMLSLNTAIAIGMWGITKATGFKKPPN